MAISHPPFVPSGAGRPGLWTATDLAGAARERPVAVAHLGLRTLSPLVADALALAASGGLLTADELGRLLDRADGPHGSVVDPAALAALALLWSGLGEDGSTRGASGYLHLARTGRLPAEQVHHQACGQALYLAGRTAELRELFPSLDRLPSAVRHDLETDLAHPALGGSQEAWEALWSRRFVQAGLVPLRVAADGPGDHLFDRLTAPAPAASTGGPLVTVIIPCWRPDEGLLTSVASITGQTYADLEVVVVDDASGPDHEELIETAAAGDERVRVLRLDRNGGSYLARRAAIAETSGELVTTQDADDWSHPQRIEQQVAALLEHPEAPASRSLAIRAKDDLTHQWFGYRAVRDNASSLMLRRTVLDRAGTFLPVRKSADSEYAERLTALVGPVVDTRTPLAVTRLRAGSLSRGDFTYQWSHPDRIAFRGSYRAWHRRLLASSGAPEEPAGQVSLTPRPPGDEDMPEVPVPFARGLEGVPTAPAHLDRCLVADLSAPPEERPELLALVEQVAGTTGLWHLELPAAQDRARPEMHEAWHDLVAVREDLHLVTRTHPCTVGVLVVLDPACLLLAVAQETAVRPAHVLVALDAGSTAPGAHGLPTDLLGVADASLSWWGRRPRWVPAPGTDPTTVGAALPHLELEPTPWTQQVPG